MRQTVDFCTADFSRKFYGDSTARWHYINLYNSDIQQVKIDYRHFRLCFYAIIADNSASAISKILSESISENLPDSVKCVKLLEKSEIRDYLHRIFPSVIVEDPLGSLGYKMLRWVPGDGVAISLFSRTP